jgi:DNA-binding CsgD family transcriptional regulator
MRLVRPSGRPALEVVVTPIGCESSPLSDHRAVAAIFLADSDAQAKRSPERLRRIYGLTPVEGEVASRIAKGLSLADISEDLATSIHTVRGHLKQLFAKTDTHRQADLVRVLLTGLADLRLE